MKMFGTSSARFGVFGFALICHAVSTQARVKTNTEVDCDHIQNQQYYSLSDMAGHWFGIEILEHVDKGRPAVDSCIHMEIKEVDASNVELFWRERNFEVVYKFVIRDQNARGVWTTLGPQSVTGTTYGYNQFAGVVHVLKASESNIVLTFCSEPHVLYSLVLTKKHTMNETELSSVHSMVNRFGVPHPVEIKKYCRNRATDTAATSVALLLVLCMISMFTNMLRGR